MKLLIVEDSQQLTDRLVPAFTASGYEVRKAATLKQAQERLTGFWPDFVLLDANFPSDSNSRIEFNAATFLDLLTGADQPSPIVILMSGDDNTALHFPKITAWLNTGRIADVLPKNVEGGWEFLKELLVHRVEILKPQRIRLGSDDEAENLRWLSSQGIVTQEDLMSNLAGKIRRIVSRTDNSVSILITGANGSGKGLIAKAIYDEMVRKAGRKLPFEIVHCSMLTEETGASHLLGYMKGAFTGAFTEKVGTLEVAADGVLFLDDIHYLPKGVLGVLLPALAERVFRR